MIRAHGVVRPIAGMAYVRVQVREECLRFGDALGRVAHRARPSMMASGQAVRLFTVEDRVPSQKRYLALYVFACFAGLGAG